MLQFNQLRNKIQTIFLVFIFHTSTFGFLNAQVGINNDNSEPDASAMLDVKSSSKGVLIPRMSSSDRQQILDPAIGLMVYDSTAQAFYYFNGMGWLELLSGSVAFLEDSDQDTKIQVEENADEDIIRFDLAGTEFMRLDSGRVEILNTGGSVYIGENAGTNDNFKSPDNQNIGIGLNVLSNSTLADKNIAIGNDALSNLVDGTVNIAIGDNALMMMEDGSDNIGIGDEALRENLDGKDNVAIGDNVLTSNIDGDDNVGIGDFTLNGNISGQDNVGIGDDALGDNLTGNDNIGIGDGTGNGNTKGNRNIFIGRGAGTSMDSLNNAVAIGAGTMVEQDSSIILGNGLKVGIGTATPDEALHVVGQIKMEDGNEQAGYVLTSDATGVGTWQVLNTQTNKITTGSGSGWEAIANSNNISITEIGLNRFQFSDNLLSFSAGFNPIDVTQTIRFNGASANNKIISIIPSNNTLPTPTNADYQLVFEVRNDTPLTIKGDGSVEINEAYTLPTTDGAADQILATDGSGNTNWTDLSSINSFQSKIEDSDGNTKIQVEESSNDNRIRLDINGTEVAQFNRTNQGDFIISPTSNNIIIGNTSGTSNTGGANIFIGEEAGRMNTTGGSNVFVGDEAGRNNMTANGNVFIGNEAGRASTAAANVYIGSTTGQQNANGTNNVMIGSSAGQSSTTGSGNIFLGFRAGRFEAGSNKLYIHNGETTDPLIYGEFNNNLLRVNGSFNTTGNTTINGTLKVGSSGSNISGIIKASISKDVGNINGNNGRTETFTVTGATVGSVVHVSPRTSLGGQIVIAQAWVSSTNTVSVRFRNTDGGGQNPPNTTYDIVVIQ